MAVPLLFELFDEIVNKSEISWFAQPANVAKRMACRESGMPAGADCHSRVEELYIRNISPSQHCDLYKDFFVDLSEKIHFCTSCLPGNEKQYKKKKYPVYDPELMLYWNENKIKFTTPPPHNPQCENRSADDGPKIVSPSTGFQYYIDEDAPQQISLQAASAPGTMTNYWYIDDKFFKSGKAGEKIFFMPSGGKHKFTCTDEQGRTSSVEIVFRKM